MNYDQLKNHIESKKAEKEKLFLFLSYMDTLILKPETKREIEAKINGEIAQCEISIRDHTIDIERILSARSRAIDYLIDKGMI